MASTGVVRSTALRAGGACVRCRKGKTKCVYENGRAPCKNCAKGMHDCYLPSESMAHHHGQSPARHAHPHRPPRESLPAAGAGAAADARQAVVSTGTTRHVQANAEKLTPELLAECERVVSKTFPACVAFHKPSFVQQLKNGTLDPALVYGLLTCAARSSPSLMRRYGGPTQAAETFAAKSIALINSNLDHPNLVDIQALCLIIIHEWGTRNAVRAYIYLGQAARMVQMYRILNTHLPTPDADLFLRDESFRRTIWLVYILDCLLTSTPGRYPALSGLDTADVSLPCSDMNFAFGNAVFVKSLRQQLDSMMHQQGQPQGSSSEVGEFGYIVLASTIWRDAVGMLTSSSLQTFREEECVQLLSKIDSLRSSLPMQFVDKPNQISLHMTMGSGYTFAMLHCLLHCATIFVFRRQLLQEVTAPNFNLDVFQRSKKCHDISDRLLTSCQSTIALLGAVESGAEKDHIPSFPIFMLFSSFTASATTAYLSLKGLVPLHSGETAASIVKDGLKFMHDGTDNWPLMGSWLRHLTVMQRVLNTDAAAAAAGVRHGSTSHGPPANVKDEIASNADTNPDAMDYDQPNPVTGLPGPMPRSHSESSRGNSEPPTALVRRPGVTTINGGSGGISPSLATVSPPSGPPHVSMHIHAMKQSPDMSPNGMAASSDGHTTSQDMTAPELCQAFERQLLDLDDLAALMGGGV